MSETLEVWIDAACVGELTRVGLIAHDRGHVRFQYDRAWLGHPRCFDIDPDLTRDQATFHIGGSCSTLRSAIATTICGTMALFWTRPGGDFHLPSISTQTSTRPTTC